jgi:hypothetical protein
MPAPIRPRLRRGVTFAAATRRKIQQFGPYKSLAVLLVPLLVVEPVKMTGLAFVGSRPLGRRSVHDCWRLCCRTSRGGSPFPGREIQTVHDAVVRAAGAEIAKASCLVALDLAKVVR